MYVNTNINSLVSQSNLFSVNNDVSRAMERLSSGTRINNASDDAAGLSISERMNSQVQGMDQAFRNAQDGISLAQSAEGSLGTITDMFQRARVLSLQASSGTYSGDNLTTIENEIKDLLEEASHIAETATFNGINLLSVEDNSVNIQISDKAGDVLEISLFDAHSLVEDLAIDLTAEDGAEKAIEDIDTALGQINDARAELGASQNRLEFISENLNTSINNTSAAKSRVLDADMTAEMSELTRGEILQQTTMAILSKSNSQPQAVVQLLNS